MFDGKEQHCCNQWDSNAEVRNQAFSIYFEWKSKPRSIFFTTNTFVRAIHSICICVNTRLCANTQKEKRISCKPYQADPMYDRIKSYLLCGKIPDIEYTTTVYSNNLSDFLRWKISTTIVAYRCHWSTSRERMAGVFYTRMTSFSWAFGYICRANTRYNKYLHSVWEQWWTPLIPYNAWQCDAMCCAAILIDINGFKNIIYGWILKLNPQRVLTYANEPTSYNIKVCARKRRTRTHDTLGTILKRYSKAIVKRREWCKIETECESKRCAWVWPERVNETSIIDANRRIARNTIDNWYAWDYPKRSCRIHLFFFFLIRFCDIFLFGCSTNQNQWQ